MVTVLWIVWAVSVFVLFIMIKINQSSIEDIRQYYQRLLNNYEKTNDYVVRHEVRIEHLIARVNNIKSDTPKS